MSWNSSSPPHGRVGDRWNERMKPRLTGLLVFIVMLSSGSALWSQELQGSSIDVDQRPAENARESASGSPGPFRMQNADSSAVLSLRFAGQLRTDWESKDQPAGQDRTSTVTMQARRVRPSMTVDLPRQRIRFRLHLSTAPGSLELMDLYVNCGLGRHLQFRAGQYKVPFTRYRIQSFQRLTFVDWALTTRYFGAERQMGFSFHNGYERPPQTAYVLGVFSGVNARASHAVGLARIYGEAAANPSDLSNPGPRAEFHPELVGHFSYNQGGIQVRSDSDEQGGGLRCSLAMNLAWDLDPVAYHDLTFRAAPELLVKNRGVSLMGAGYAGLAKVGESGRKRWRWAMAGLLAQTSFRFNERYELSLRYAAVDFDEEVLDAALARADQLISKAEDKFSDGLISPAGF